MKDREFLIWIHERLEHVHGEDPSFDYMHKLRAIIIGINHEKITNIVSPCNSMDELRSLKCKK